VLITPEHSAFFGALRILYIATMTDEIKEKFTGKWRLDRSEKFDEFLAAMGEHLADEFSFLQRCQFNFNFKL
jgi:hypothetical protein